MTVRHQVGVVGVPLDPAADERTERDDLQSLVADVVERGPHQPAAQASGFTSVWVKRISSPRRW
jgi:hypothetical protein